MKVPPPNSPRPPSEPHSTDTPNDAHPTEPSPFSEQSPAGKPPDSHSAPASNRVAAKDITTGAWKLIRYSGTLKEVQAALEDSPAFTETVNRVLKQQNNAHHQSHSPALRRCFTELQNKTVCGVDPSETPRSRYKGFLHQYRALCQELEETPNHDPLRDDLTFITKQIARTFFTEVDLKTFPADLVQAVKTHADPKRHFLPVTENSGEAIARRLFQSQQLISKQTQVLSESHTLSRWTRNFTGGLFGGELGVNYDPFFQGNTPYRLFQLQTEDSTALCIRMGTPTAQSLPHNPEIIPEFVQFIESQLPHEHHLYINRQKRSGVEGMRSDVLEGTGEEGRLREGLTVITLPADGDFVAQTGPFAEEVGVDGLRMTLVEQMLNNHSGFYFPPRLTKRFGGPDAFATTLNDAFEKERRALKIPPDGPLPMNLRRALLFHFLNYRLVTLLVDTLKPTTYNNTCKDDIDRGGMANAYMFAMQNRPEAGASAAELEDFVRDLEGVTFAPALIVKKRAVVPHRFNDLINALNELNLPFPEERK